MGLTPGRPASLAAAAAELEHVGTHGSQRAGTVARTAPTPTFPGHSVSSANRVLLLPVLLPVLELPVRSRLELGRTELVLLLSLAGEHLVSLHEAHRQLWNFQRCSFPDGGRSRPFLDCAMFPSQAASDLVKRLVCTY